MWTNEKYVIVHTGCPQYPVRIIALDSSGWSCPCRSYQNALSRIELLLKHELPETITRQVMILGNSIADEARSRQ
jgi:hypothetical protein